MYFVNLAVLKGIFLNVRETVGLPKIKEAKTLHVKLQQHKPVRRKHVCNKSALFECFDLAMKGKVPVVCRSFPEYVVGNVFIRFSWRLGNSSTASISTE